MTSNVKNTKHHNTLWTSISDCSVVLFEFCQFSNSKYVLRSNDGKSYWFDCMISKIYLQKLLANIRSPNLYDQTFITKWLMNFGFKHVITLL